MREEATDPDVKRASLLGKGTRDYDLEEARDARKERANMLAGFAAEKADLLENFKTANRGKSLIIFALIAANLFQGAMLLGKSLDLKVDESGLEASTGEGSPAEAP